MRTYKSNRKEVQRRMDAAKKTMLEAVGKAAAGYIKMNTAVDTGALRGSVDYKVSKDNVYAGSTLIGEDYPIYVEKGTSKMAAQPYISTGILGNADGLKKVAEANYKP